MFFSLFHLGRFDKPIGAILLLLPCLWGLALVQGLFIDWSLVILFTLGAFVMRAAGCIVNDLFDRDIDRQVQRTRLRPLAAGSVTVFQAMLFLGVLCGIGLMILLCLPLVCWILGGIAAVLSILYPLAKRYTPCPQVILGITFNMGVPIAAAAVTSQWTESVVWLTYGAAVFWTISYDTIYALQDRVDDLKLNVGSTAILFGSHVLFAVGLLYTIMHIILGIVFYQLGSGPIGYGILGLTYFFTMYKLYFLDIENPEACRSFFVGNEMIGSLIFLGLLLR